MISDMNILTYFQVWQVPKYIFQEPLYSTIDLSHLSGTCPPVIIGITVAVVILRNELSGNTYY
jgi:hypothetical protein